MHPPYPNQAGSALKGLLEKVLLAAVPSNAKILEYLDVGTFFSLT